MMTVVSLKGAARDCAKYASETHDAAKGVGYYQQRDGAPSAWHGALADEFGLSGSPVDLDVLTAALDGHMPNGVDVSARGNRQANHRLGADLTFHAPKSVSIAALAGGDEGLVAAHERAVARALKFIEAEVVRARLGRGGTRSEVTGKMLAASFLHETSRPVSGHADPQLHTHCLLANVTQRSDGTWCAMDLQFGFRGELLKLAGAVYRAELAKDLQSQGIELRRTTDGFFELASITDAQIEHFSQRSQQIEKQLAERGTSRGEASAKEKLAANHATRETKKQIPKDQQRWEWRTEARAQGVDLTTPERAALVPDRPDLSAAAVRSGARHISERETVFSANGVRLAALAAGIIDADIESIDREIASGTAGLLSAGEDDQGRALYTTRDALYREQHTLARARAGRGKVDALMTDEQVRDYISQREQSAGFQYSDGQRDAIALALTTRDTVSGVVGAAGAGKTTSMKEIVAAYQGAGYEVIGIATTGQATRELRSANTNETRTLASLLAAPQTSTTPRLYLLDEAGMVSARDMDRLMERAETENARLLLVGDPKQLKAVEAGCPFEQMLDTNAIQHAMIDEIQRQVDLHLREIVQHFAHGAAHEAVAAARPYIATAEITADDFAAAEAAKPTADQDSAAPAEPTQGMVNYAKSLGMDAPEGATFQQVREYLDTHSPQQLGFDERARDGASKGNAPKAPEAVRRAAIARTTAANYLRRDRETRDRTLVVSGTNAVRREVNERIREGLRESGEVGKDDLQIQALDKSDMTREQATRCESYTPGMVVRLESGRGKTRTTTDYSVTGTGGNRVTLRDAAGQEKLWNPARERATGVYDPREINLSPGDAIIFKENQGRGGDRIVNGQTAKIERADAQGIDARLDDGREIHLDPRQNHSIDYGWCRTVHSSQGATVDHVVVAGEASRAATAETAYVACSRERESLAIITDSPEKLQQSWEQWAGRKHARDAARNSADPHPNHLPELRSAARAELGKEGDLAAAREARTDRGRDPDSEAKRKEKEQKTEKEPRRSTGAQQRGDAEESTLASARAELAQVAGRITVNQARAEQEKENGRGREIDLDR